MKMLLLIVGGVLIVLVAIVLILPFVVPVEAYKGQIEAQVERATGRNFEIRGPVELSILPSLAVQADDVHLANVPGAAEADMASLKELQVQLELWPLLTGTVEVARFVLVEPVIHLEIDQEGRPNWQLGDATAEPARGTEPEAPSEGEGTTVPIADLKLGDIRIENGTITYTDATSGTSERLEAVNLSVDLPDIRSPLNAEGSLRYKEQPVELQLAVQSPLSVLEGGSSPLTLSTDSDLLDLAFDGTVQGGPSPAAEGSVELDVASIRDLSAWLAEPIEFHGEGLRNLAITGQLQGSAERVAFTGATIDLDDIDAKGEVSADLSGAVPKITGRLDVAALNLNPYLPATAPQPAPERGAEGQAGTGAGDAPAGWSDEPIALPAIGGVEVDFELTVGSFTYQKIELGRSVLGLTLQDNTFIADLREFALYGGQGSGSLQLALQNGTPVIKEQFRLDGLQALPFLQAAADFDRLEGRASAEITTQTRGNTERQLVQNLNGNGNVTFRDGAIVGINIAGMVRNAANAFLNPEAGEARKTDFAELGGSFNIQNGILSNQDMRLQAPVLRVNGSGRINLPQRTMNYRIEPTAAPTLEGQGGRGQVAGILVPVVIQGPWDDLKYKPDLSGVVQQALENPEQLKRQIEQLGGSASQAQDALKELRKDPKRLLEGLTGGGSGEQGGGSKEQEDPAQRLLKGLFNR
jgi:AsmA protein